MRGAKRLVHTYKHTDTKKRKHKVFEIWTCMHVRLQTDNVTEACRMWGGGEGREQDHPDPTTARTHSATPTKTVRRIQASP